MSVFQEAELYLRFNYKYSKQFLELQLFVLYVLGHFSFVTDAPGL